MRVQLSLRALLVLGTGLSGVSVAHAQPESAVRARAAVYQDDDYTTVVTSAVEASGAIGETAAVRAGYLVDVTSSASVDVVSAATDRWTERRDEYRAGADLYVGDAVLSADYVRSVEPDWDSHRIVGGGAIDLAQRATTLSLGGGVILNDVGRADEDGSQGAFSQTQNAYVLNARLTQVLSPDALVSLGYSAQWVEGYQSSPYRFVRVGPTQVYPETHPTRRHRHALVAQLRYALSADVSFGIDERVYVDSWGVVGTTTAVTLGFEVSDTVDLWLKNRFHYQAAAWFYRDSYAEPLQYMSSDRELATFFDDYLGPAIAVTFPHAGPFHELRLDLSLEGFAYRFVDFSELPWRFGLVAGAGVSGRFE